jgi:hypothetical protein
VRACEGNNASRELARRVWPATGICHTRCPHISYWGAVESNHWLATAKRDHGASMCGGVRHGSVGELGAAAARRARTGPSHWMVLRAHAHQPRTHARSACWYAASPWSGAPRPPGQTEHPPACRAGQSGRAHLAATGGACRAPMSVGGGVGVGCRGSPEAVGPRRPPMADDGRAPPAVSAATSAEGPLPSSRRSASVSPNVVAMQEGTCWVLPPCFWISDPSVQCRVNPPRFKAHSISSTHQGYRQQNYRCAAEANAEQLPTAEAVSRYRSSPPCSLGIWQPTPLLRSPLRPPPTLPARAESGLPTMAAWIR